MNMSEMAASSHVAERRDLGASAESPSSRRLAKTRYLVELQGFTGLDDATLVAVAPWIRFTPALCVAAVLVALLSGMPALLLALLPFAAAGVVLDNSPFDAIYNLGIRRVTNGPRIPRYGAPRRFACFVAATWLAVTWLAFAAGATSLAQVLGVVFVLVAAVPVVTGLCLPSLMFSRIRRRLRA